jgi:hypothetical protein
LSAITRQAIENTNRAKAEKNRQYPAPRSPAMYSLAYRAMSVPRPVTKSIHRIVSESK